MEQLFEFPEPDSQQLRLRGKQNQLCSRESPLSYAVGERLAPKRHSAPLCKGPEPGWT